MDREALEQLSKDQLIELVLSLLQRVADLEARIAELSRPPKTPDNSSTPPSQGRKPNAMRPTPAKERVKDSQIFSDVRFPSRERRVDDVG